MKRLFVLLVNMICFYCEAQYTKNDFLDSLKNTIYLKDYFNKYEEYIDSNYALYINSCFPLDTFEVDSNSGFGYHPTSISISYNNSSYLKFYPGLCVLKGRNKQIKELAFYNYNGQKTGLRWTFYKNGSIEEINYFKPELIDTVNSYGKLFSNSPSYKFKKFKRSGNIELTGSYREGKKNGEWFYYDNKGILFKKEVFKDNYRTSRISF